ncbi:MAG: hypothetical protein HN368_18125 [Spirochaetales bacterium]|jgi:hypothetical protein|nr:hypothetical protein [Spirochaetales bacterium]
MEMKDALIRAIGRYRSDLDRIDDWFEPSSRRSSRDFERWGAIDFIAHSAFFAERRIRIIEDLSGVEPLGDFDQALRSVFDRHTGSTWDEVTGMLRTSLDGLKSLASKRDALDLEALDDDDQPMWRSIAFYGILHSSGHVAEAMIRAGNLIDAVSLQRRVTESLKEINQTDRWVGLVDFNLARVLARAGDADAAAVAGDAVSRDPDLGPRMKQDPDFVAIRDELGAD